MTTLPPIHTWFNTLDWNLSFYENTYRNYQIDDYVQCYEKQSAVDSNSEWSTKDMKDNESLIPASLLEAMSDCQLKVDDDSGITDDNRSLRGRLQKSSSLKTRKPENKCEPQRRKSVRFADTLGLNLENVRLIDNKCKPTVPTSAFSDLKISQSNETVGQVNTYRNWTAPCTLNSSPKLMLDFVEPFSCVDYLERVKKQKVCLQNCFVSMYGPNANISCIISVVNISFEKSVSVRYTSDYWQTVSTVTAKYVPNSSNVWSDKFVADFVVNTDSSFSDMVPGKQIMFAIQYSVDGNEYWDNNMGLNYSLSCRL